MTRPARLGAVLATFGLICGALVAPAALAATFNVTDLSDSGANTLRAAIVSANANAGADIIKFQPGIVGTVALASVLPSITGDLTIIGVAPSKLTIDGADAIDGFVTSGAVNLTISRMTLANFRNAVDATSVGSVSLADVAVSSSGEGAAVNVHGALKVLGGDLTLNRVSMSANSGYLGGAVSFLPTAAGDSLTVADSVFTSNSGNGGAGGAIYVAAAANQTNSITRSAFVSNTSASSGAMLLQSNSGFSSTTSISNCTFSANSASTGAGTDGVYAFGNSQVAISFSTFSGHDNTSVSSTGFVVYSNSGADVAMTASIIANNPQTGGGTIRECGAGGGGSTFSGSENLTPDTFCPGRIGSPTNVSATLAQAGGFGGTHRLNAGSNALGAYAGSACPLTDQRGIARPALDTDCDLGAWQTLAQPPQKAMTVPFTIFVRPGGTSYNWNFTTDNFGLAVLDTGLQNLTAFNWFVTRGRIEHSSDSGVTWTPYLIEDDSINAFLTTATRLWRFVDTSPADTTTTNSASHCWHLVSTPASTSCSGGNVIPDNAPTDIASSKATLFDNTAVGANIATLTPTDTGDTLRGYWTLESQSVANLFALSFNRTTGNTATITRGSGTVPAIGQTPTLTVRYHDVYQTDASGNPIAGAGFSKLLTFTVVAETSNALTLGNDVAVNTFTTGNQAAQAAALLTTGNVAVVWQSAGQGGGDTTTSGIYGQLLSNAGAKVGGEFVVSNVAGGIDEIAPAVTGLAGGRYVVAYSSRVGGDADIKFRLVEANGSVGSEFIANSTTAGDQYTPALVTLTGGNFVVAWSADSGNVVARTFNTSGAAATAEVVFADGSIAGGYYPAVAALSDGNYALAWVDFTASHAVVRVGGGSAVDTGMVSGGYAGPRLAGLSGGGFVAASESFNAGSGQYQVEAIRYSNAGAVQTAKFQVNTVSTGNHYAASVAALTGGGFVVGWGADNGDFDLSGIFGRRYSATAVAVDGAEFEINQHRLDDQNYPALAPLAGNLFAATWTEVTGASITAGTYFGDIEARVLQSPDTTPPTATVTVADTSLLIGETSLVSFAFSEAVTGFTNVDLSIPNGTLTAVATADGGINFTATLTPNAGVEDASNVIGLNMAGVTDLSSNAGSGTTNSNNYAIDTVRPTITSVVVADTALIIGETSLVTITFSEAVNNFSNVDLTIPNATLTAVSSSNGVTWTATLTPNASVTDASNMITVNLATLTDLPGNAGSGSSLSNNYAIDTVRPSLSSAITITDTALKIGDTATVTFTYTEAVTGFTSADVNAPNASLSAPSSGDGGITWTATLTPTAGITDASNVLTLDYAGILDLPGNAGTGSVVSGNYVVDTQRPTVVSFVVADTSLLAGETSSVTVVYSEPVSGFTTADLTVENGVVSSLSTGDGGITWTMTLTPTAAIVDATNLITLDLTGVTDLSGNPGAGSSLSNNYAINTVRPTVSVLVADTLLVSGETSLVTFTFSEAVSGFANADLSIANGTLTAVSSADGNLTYTATLTPSAGVNDSTNVITVTNAGYTNTAGNAGSGTTDSNNYAVDTVARSLSIDDVSVTEGNGSGATLNFTVTVTPAAADGGVSFSIATQDGTAAAPGDYTASSLSGQTIAAGLSTLSFAVTVNGDNLVESNETVLVNLSAVTGAVIGDGQGVGTITDDDSATVQFSPGTVSQSEALTTMAFTVTLSNPVQSGVTLALNSTPGTATATDFTANVGGTVSFPANSNASQTVNVLLNNDALDENDEAFMLTLSGLTATGSVTLGTATAIGTIQDDDPTPTLSITSPSQSEGNASTSVMNFVVSLSALSGRDVSFTRATTDGTATVGNNDYVGLPAATVTILAGQPSATIGVTINGDTPYEGDESFSLDITGVTNATPTSFSGTGTILDDDQQPTTTTIGGQTPASTVTGQPYTVDVTVVAQTTSPLGTVTIRDGALGSPVCTATLAAGAAPSSSGSCALTSVSAGTKTLTADYAPASTAFAASSDTDTHLVNPAATVISVVGPARSRINQPATYTFALSVNAPGGGSPAGTVTLSSGASSCNVSVPTGTPSCALTFNTLGARTITAAFVPSDGSYQASTSGGAGNAQTLVFALSELAITKTDGLSVYRPGDLIVYTVTVRNSGPDTAANIRVRDDIPGGLSNVSWSCDASGGAVCAPTGGSGSLNVIVPSLVNGGLLTYTFYGNVAGAPLSIVNTALIELPADTTVEDPTPGNNSATDTDLADNLFANGFEDALVNAPNGRYVVPGTALRGVLDAVAVPVYTLDDARGEALRVYARVFDGQLQYALATRNDSGQLRLSAWASFASDPTLTWHAHAFASGWILDSAELQ